MLREQVLILINMSKKEKTFLGVGWGFPPTFDKTSSNVTMVSNELDIKQSLHIYFNTKLGERIMRPDYGCVVYDYLFDLDSDGMLGTLAVELKKTLRKYEPRINVFNVDISRSNKEDGVIMVKVDYEIEATNVRDNIVYPFYINEGTNIK